MKQQEFKISSIAIECTDLEEQKVIVRALLNDLITENLLKITNKIKRSICSTKAKQKKLFHDITITQIPRIYYALDFEIIDIKHRNDSLILGSIVICTGMDLEMNKTHLGTWFKENSNNNEYEFWLKICEEIKDSGVKSLYFKLAVDNPWLGEAINKVFEKSE